MGRQGGSRHLKRKPAPKSWSIHRKELVWTVKPKPGPHRISNCIPLLLIVRDILGLAKSRKDAKTIISQGEVKVDGDTEREDRFPVGLMDVISVPALEKAYRVLPSGKGLMLHPIDAEEAKLKLCRIENKRVIKGGHMQLNLHDGRCVLVQVEDPKNPEKNVYRALDVLKIGIPDQEVLEHSNLVEGMPAIIFGGKNMGRHGSIFAFEERLGQKRRNQLVTIEDEDGIRFQTIVDLVFPLGHKKPWISLPEVR
ncbi:MAG: 30S ribosomal protein S4e [Candidatus Bathyarchaeota archaeon]|nr:MAG: 30S ribosomal protein S4e [Candidatus Bathyarchaeota archaeon]